MNRTDAPKKQPVVFGTNGQRENLPDTTPAGDNTASYDAGFPAVTMILKSAGGLPPKGQDMNQILFELSAIGRWLSAGALNSYDATFSTAIGGYPKAAVLVGDDGATIFISTAEANTNDPNTTATGWLNLSKITAIAALAGGEDTLPYFTGTNTADQTTLTTVGRDVIGQTSIDNLLIYLGLQNVANALIKTNNLSDVSSVPTARTNLVVPKGVDKQMCNEWAVFDASSGAVVIGNSIGISSIVRTVKGKYTVNLSTPYPNANYCVVGRASAPGEGNGHELYVGSKTASSFNLITCSDSGDSYPTYDPPDVAIAIFGAKS